MVLSITNLAVGANRASAQSPKPCKQVLCSPTVSLLPVLNRSHLGGGPDVKSLATGVVSQLPPQNNLEIIIFTGIPTLIPQFSLFVSTQWLPTATASENPYTQYTATELGGPVRTPGLSVTGGAQYNVVTPGMTRGWLTVTPYVGDNFSPAQRPSDESAFTHKLDVGGSVTAYAFHWEHRGVWLRQLGVVGVFDYRATDMPHAGDVVPAGERVFLTNARPALLLVGLSIPIAPLVATE
jgi:hypothetical protein